MSAITTTNIRVGPGVYLALKELADKSGMTIGTCANLLIITLLYNADKSLSGFRPETQKALTADALAAIGELFKIASLEAIRNTSIAELYQNLLSQPKEK
jgi:hypothetical protein